MPTENNDINLLLTEREGRTGEYWPEVVAVRYKTTEGQYFPVRLELAWLVSSLLYGTRVMLVCFLLKHTSGHLKRPFSKMAAENLNKSKLKTNTSTRKSI